MSNNELTYYISTQYRHMTKRGMFHLQKEKKMCKIILFMQYLKTFKIKQYIFTDKSLSAKIKEKLDKI